MSKFIEVYVFHQDGTYPFHVRSDLVEVVLPRMVGEKFDGSLIWLREPLGRLQIAESVETVISMIEEAEHEN